MAVAFTASVLCPGVTTEPLIDVTAIAVVARVVAVDRGVLEIAAVDLCEGSSLVRGRSCDAEGRSRYCQAAGPEPTEERAPRDGRA